AIHRRIRRTAPADVLRRVTVRSDHGLRASEKRGDLKQTGTSAHSGATVRRSALRALIADDDPGVLSTLQRILTKNGYEVAIARDGEEAWVLASSINFDVVVTDLEMPKCGGVELFNSIRQSKPDIPFVF